MSVSALIQCIVGLATDTDERGASAVEYALLVGFIAAVIVLSVATFGASVSDLFGIDLTP